MIKSTSLDKFTIYTDDGTYLELLNNFLANKIPYQVLTDKKSRAVWLIEVDGIKYTIKWNIQTINHFDQKIKRSLQGSFYPHLFKRIKKAKQQGCDIIGSIYVVAEHNSPTGLETYLLSEYVEGTRLWQYGDDYVKYKEAIKTAVKQLHQYGLASCDLNNHNILITQNDSVKIIDLSDNGVFAIAKAKDARQLKKFYDIDLYNRKGFLYHLIGIRDKLIKLSRRVRNKQ